MNKRIQIIMVMILALASFFYQPQASHAESELNQDNTKETATPMQFISGNANDVWDYDAIKTGIFKDEDDVHFATFTLDEPAVVDVAINQLENAGIGVDLYNDKDELLESWATIHGKKDGVPLFYQGLPAGTYYLRLTIDDGTVENTNYRLLVRQSRDQFVEREGNNTKQTANPIMLGTTHFGFTDYDTVDYFRFETKATGNVTIESTYSPTISLFYTLYNSKGVAVKKWEVKPNKSLKRNNLSTVNVAAGTYYLVVSQTDKKIANEYYEYQVNFTAGKYTEIENNDVIEKSTPIQSKITYNAVMGPNGDIDFYKLSVNASGNYVLSMTQAATTLKISVLDSNKKAIKTLYTKRAPSGMRTIGTISLKKGTYYLKVQIDKGKNVEQTYKMLVNPTK